MKRWATHLFITAYLGVLGFGLLSHAMTFLKTAHPAMYFIVWDMFCGWCAYESRLHIVGEGASGDYYELSPAPWGEFRPFSAMGRTHYDSFAQFSSQIASNTLAHTEHEPMVRIHVVEECWPKKYNLSERVWQARYEVAKTPHSYFHHRCIFNPQGDTLHRAEGWVAVQSEIGILNNPRLRAEMRRGHTFYASNPGDRQSSGVVPTNYESPTD